MKSPPPLGPRLALHRDRQFGWRDLPLFILPGSLAILAPAVVGLDALFGGYAKHGPAFALDRSLPWFALALLAAMLFFGLLAYRLAVARRFVAVHQNGILLALNPRRVYLWQQLEGISVGAWRGWFTRSPGKMAFNARLHPRQASPIPLPRTLENMDALLTRCKAHLYLRLLPLSLTSFKAGERLSFGSLMLDSSALHFPGGETLWTELTSLSVHSGKLVIESTNQRSMRIPIAQIPNLEILLQVARSAIPAQAHSSPQAEGVQHL